MLVPVLWATLASALATGITSAAITSGSANISASTTSAQLYSTLGSFTASQTTRSSFGSLPSITTVSTTLFSQSTSAISSSITILPTSSVNDTSTYSLSNVASTSTSSSANQPSQSLDPGTLTDIETIRERRLSIILEGIDPTSVANISAWLSTLGEDGKWPDSEVDYTTGCDARRANWPAETHWNRIVTMSAAWHRGVAGSSNFVNSTSLLDAISRAMDYWYMNDFTDPSCLDSGGLPVCPCGTPGFWNTNWFSNIIGIPELVGEACLLVGADVLTVSQVGNCTNILGRAFGTFGRNVNGLGFLTGANTLDVAKIGIDSGLLVDNATIIADGYSRIHNEVVVQNATKADGIRADGSFGQHGGIIYNGNYGKDYTNDVLALEIAGAGTKYSAQNATTGSQFAFETLLQGDLWMIYRNVLTNVLHWDFSVLPRFITFPVSDNQATASIKINITQIEELGELWDSDVMTSVYESLNSSSKDANSGKIHGNRMFYANDYMVQRGSGYVSTLRMYSSRTQNSECVNSQNPFGFHLSDGTLYTYLQGNEYEDIAAAWDWNLIPGITTDYGATPLNCSFVQFTGKEAFVGGASDGKVGAAAMRYTNPYTGSLSFQKAWFFLDDDVQHVMIPFADSNATTDHDVLSVLDQKRLSGPVYVNGIPLPHSANVSHALSLWHDGVGYTFDSRNPLRPGVDLGVAMGPRSGDWATIGISTVGNITVDLFSAYVDHGAPGSALALPVAYSAFPGTRSAGAFASKSAKAALTLWTLRNDASVSAVFDAQHRMFMAVFWDAQGGEVDFVPGVFEARLTVQASAASVVLYKLDKGEVTVADPSQTLAGLRVSVSVGMFGSRPKGWGFGATKMLDVDLPSGGIAGSSVTTKL